MGYKTSSDKNSIYLNLSRMMAEISSPYNDGFVASGYKHELYKIKCFLDDSYANLPTFVGEEEWEKQRMVEVLARKSHGRV